MFGGFATIECSGLSFILFDTSLGWMGILSSPRGLKRVILPKESREEVLSQTKDCGYLTEDYDFDSFGDLPQRLRRYLAGEPVDFSDRLDLAGTTRFQQNVWQIVRTVPYGQTKSYAWVAGRLGPGKLARAVGQALARNPLPIIIPCHRVISGDGSLGGFSDGVEMKKYLLRLEVAI